MSEASATLCWYRLSMFEKTRFSAQIRAPSSIVLAALVVTLMASTCADVSVQKSHDDTCALLPSVVVVVAVVSGCCTMRPSTTPV